MLVENSAIEAWAANALAGMALILAASDEGMKYTAEQVEEFLEGIMKEAPQRLHTMASLALIEQVSK